MPSKNTTTQHSDRIGAIKGEKWQGSKRHPNKVNFCMKQPTPIQASSATPPRFLLSVTYVNVVLTTRKSSSFFPDLSAMSRASAACRDNPQRPYVQLSAEDVENPLDVSFPMFSTKRCCNIFTYLCTYAIIYIYNTYLHIYIHGMYWFNFSKCVGSTSCAILIFITGGDHLKARQLCACI